MSHQLSFNQLLLYDPGKEGITVAIELKLGSKAVALEAKIDTGASFCFFQPNHGKNLRLDIESGLPLQVSTVTGSFLAYGHSVTESSQKAYLLQRWDEWR